MQKVSKNLIEVLLSLGQETRFYLPKNKWSPKPGANVCPRKERGESLRWRADFAVCNLLLQKVNPERVSRRQTPTCCTCGCIQWKDFYGQGQKGQGSSSRSHFSWKAMLNSKLLNMSLCSQQNKHKLRNIKLQVLGKEQESTMCRCCRGPRLSQASHMFPVLCYQAMKKMTH